MSVSFIDGKLGRNMMIKRQVTQPNCLEIVRYVEPWFELQLTEVHVFIFHFIETHICQYYSSVSTALPSVKKVSPLAFLPA